MIARLIGWSARNLVLVLIGTVFVVGRNRVPSPAAGTTADRKARSLMDVDPIGAGSVSA